MESTAESSRVRWLFDFEHWNPTEDEWSQCLSKLPSAEVARIGRFKRPQNGTFLVGRQNPNAKSSAVGWLMLQKCSREAHPDCDSKDLQIERTKEGKPYLRSDGRSKYPHFNMNASHAGNYVAFGSEPEYLVGVDVMDIKIPHNSPMSQFFEDMQSCFTPKEWSVIYRGNSEKDKTKRFFVFWCLKESYIKAVGIGLGFELQRAEFTVDDEANPTSATISIDKINRPDWVFELHFHDDHVIGVSYGPLMDATPGYISAAIPDVRTDVRLRSIVPKASAISRVPFRVLSIEELLRQ